MEGSFHFLEGKSDRKSTEESLRAQQTKRRLLLFFILFGTIVNAADTAPNCNMFTAQLDKLTAIIGGNYHSYFDRVALFMNLYQNDLLSTRQLQMVGIKRFSINFIRGLCLTDSTDIHSPKMAILFENKW